MAVASESSPLGESPAAVVLARLSSSRLPGKVLADIGGTPLLQLTLDRVARCGAVGTVLVAISTDPSDDPLAAWCAERGVLCHRGPLDHVAQRSLGAAQAVGAEWFFRVNADRPFVATELFAPAVELAAEGEADVVSNVWPHVLPPGAVVELIRTDALAAEVEHFDAEEAEHVTLYLYRHPERIRHRHLGAESYRVPGDIRLVVDDATDLDRVRRVVSEMDRPPWSYGLQEVMDRVHRVTSDDRDGAGAR